MMHQQRPQNLHSVTMEKALNNRKKTKVNSLFNYTFLSLRLRASAVNCFNCKQTLAATDIEHAPVWHHFLFPEMRKNGTLTLLIIQTIQATLCSFALLHPSYLTLLKVKFAYVASATRNHWNSSLRKRFHEAYILLKAGFLAASSLYNLSASLSAASMTSFGNG